MPKDDWRFDVGMNEDGEFAVEAWASTIPDKRFRALTRKELMALRATIDDALRRYPKPHMEAGR